MTVTENDTIVGNIFEDDTIQSNGIITGNETISADTFTGTSVMQFPGVSGGFESDAFSTGFNI